MADEYDIETPDHLSVGIAPNESRSPADMIERHLHMALNNAIIHCNSLNMTTFSSLMSEPGKPNHSEYYFNQSQKALDRMHEHVQEIGKWLKKIQER